ncbi:MAG: hypothetical protein J0H57_03265 [Rhodospirillales bacterium]|nr:hypothetical protein [Rhodospirillales bacterium]
MSHITGLRTVPCPPLCVVPRPSGLSEGDLRRGLTRLSRRLPDWGLERQEDCDRAVFATISRREEDEEAPVFAVFREGATIILGMVARDRYVRLGRHERIEAAIEAIVELLDSCCAMAA